MIVITTPTGAIGSQVLAHLLDSGEPVRVIAREPARLPAYARERVEVVTGSHGDPDVVDRAFAGADTVFWLAPPDPLAASVEASYLDFSRPACAALKNHGVARVVGVSALGHGTPLSGTAGLVSASLAMDGLFTDTGVAYRSLALPSFMDNMLRQVATIRDPGVFYSPLSADLRSPTCATGDIAAVAAALLRDPSWSGQGRVALLGPEDLSCDDLAQIMSDVLGRPIRFQRVTGAQFKADALARGVSEAFAQAMLEMMVAKDRGLDNAEPRTPGSTTPTSFRTWCERVLLPAVRA